MHGDRVTVPTMTIGGMVTRMIENRYYGTHHLAFRLQNPIVAGKRVGRRSQPRRSNPHVAFTRTGAVAFAVAPSSPSLHCSSSTVGVGTSAADAPVHRTRSRSHSSWPCSPTTRPAVQLLGLVGRRRSGGRRHQGTDIMSPRGTDPILAVADGVVAGIRDRHRMSGHYIRLDHGGGWKTTYMHLNNDTFGTDDGEGGLLDRVPSPRSSVGSRKSIAGEVIGYVGDSGNAEGTQPHTHFEVKFDGREDSTRTRSSRTSWERERRRDSPAVRIARTRPEPPVRPGLMSRATGDVDGTSRTPHRASPRSAFPVNVFCCET